jgi:hypothetical protein
MVFVLAYGCSRQTAFCGYMSIKTDVLRAQHGWGFPAPQQTESSFIGLLRH